MIRLLITALVLVFTASCAQVPSRSLARIDADANRTLERLYEYRPATRALLGGAAGVLIFPRNYKGGIGIGAEFGDGLLREGGRTSGYYRIVSGSIGFQLGAQRRGQVIAFMDREALARFKRGSGWEIGVDGSVVVAEFGASGELTTTSINQPILAFIVGEVGLMYNATLEGAKISRLEE